MSIFFDLEEEDSSQLEFLTNNSHICVVKFTASWCGPCKKLTEKLNISINNDSTISSQILTPEMVNKSHGMDCDLKNKISFISVDVDVHEELAALNSVSALPYIKFYRNGNQMTQVIKGCDPDGVLKTVKSLL
jgi:thiol-disulfide isomerase/thioredoxin